MTLNQSQLYCFIRSRQSVEIRNSRKADLISTMKSQMSKKKSHTLREEGPARQSDPGARPTLHDHDSLSYHPFLSLPPQMM